MDSGLLEQKAPVMHDKYESISSNYFSDRNNQALVHLSTNASHKLFTKLYVTGLSEDYESHQHSVNNMSVKAVPQ